MESFFAQGGFLEPILRNRLLVLLSMAENQWVSPGLLSPNLCGLYMSLRHSIYNWWLRAHLVPFGKLTNRHVFFSTFFLVFMLLKIRWRSSSLPLCYLIPECHLKLKRTAGTWTRRWMVQMIFRISIGVIFRFKSRSFSEVYMSTHIRIQTPSWSRNCGVPIPSAKNRNG